MFHHQRISFVFYKVKRANFSVALTKIDIANRDITKTTKYSRQFTIFNHRHDGYLVSRFNLSDRNSTSVATVYSA